MKTHRFALLSFFLLLGASIASFSQDKVAVAAAANAKVEFENDQIRVVRVSLAPYEKTQMEGHPARFVVTITKNDVRLYFPDGPSKTSTHAAQDFFWSESSTHQVENLSNAPMQNIEIELKRSKDAGVEIKPTAGESKASGTAKDPVSVEQEPHHEVVFENQYVRVLDVVIRPFETTLFHTHALDNVAIQLSDARIKRQSAGGDWIASDAKEGSVGFNAGTKKPYTHRIANEGTTVFHVLDIEILDLPSAKY